MDWYPIIQTALIALIPLIVAVFGGWLKSHMQDQSAAEAITQALGNGLGAMQQAVQKGLTDGAVTRAGVEYVKAAVPAAIARDPAANTDAMIGARLDARVGVANIQANLAVAASPSPLAPKPLDPVVSEAVPLEPYKPIPVTTINKGYTP